MPEGWRLGHVRDLILRLDAGVSVNGEDRPRKAGEVCVLKVSAVSSGRFDPTQYKVITDNEVCLARVNPKADHILISRSNTAGLVGASCYLDSDHDYLFLPDKLWLTVASPNTKPNMLWLSYWLAADFTRVRLSKLGTGSSGSMKNISKEEVLSLPISIPPRSQQVLIARTLATWDRAIATTEKLIKNGKNRKKWLVQKLLCERSSLGGNISNWCSKTISELVEIRYGKSPSEIKSDDGAYQIYGTGGHVGFAMKALHSGPAVILGRKGTLDKPIFLDCPFWAIDTTFYCIPLDGCEIKWFFHRVEALGLSAYSEASGVPSLSRETVSAISLLVPPLDVQRKISAILDCADEEIRAWENFVEKLRGEKSALMQKLLTGKHRVPTNDDNQANEPPI